MQNQVKNHLDTIMELVEGKLPEGDYLEISNALKEVYTITSETAKKIRVSEIEPVVFTTNCTPQRFYTPREQHIDRVSFRLTIDEQRIILFRRLDMDFQYYSGLVCTQIEITKREIKDRAADKKANFQEIKRLKTVLSGEVTYDQDFWDMKWSLKELEKDRKKFLEDDRVAKKALVKYRENWDVLKNSLDIMKGALEASMPLID